MLTAIATAKNAKDPNPTAQKQQDPALENTLNDAISDAIATDDFETALSLLQKVISHPLRKIHKFRPK